MGRTKVVKRNWRGREDKVENERRRKKPVEMTPAAELTLIIAP
jgi:hypothetical protein